MIGFHRFLGTCSIGRAEIWGIIRGSSMGIELIEVECDSAFVVDAITRELPVSSELFSLVGMARELFSKFRRWKLNHRWRESNRCAHVLGSCFFAGSPFISAVAGGAGFI